MRTIYARMAELEREGRRFAVCTVVRTVGSTPQVVGAKLLVDDLGRLTGTLGGGCVEGDAFEEANRVLDTGNVGLREYELTEDLAGDATFSVTCLLRHPAESPSRSRRCCAAMARTSNRAARSSSRPTGRPVDHSVTARSMP